MLAALAVTGAFVAVVLPYAARLATHWWVGEATVEAADGWMQAVSRMGDDVAQAVPYGLGGRPEAAASRGRPSAPGRTASPSCGPRSATRPGWRR